MRYTVPRSPGSDADERAESIQATPATNSEREKAAIDLQESVDRSLATPAIKARQYLREHPQEQEIIWNTLIKKNDRDIALVILTETDFRTLKAPALIWAIHDGHVALAYHFLNIFREQCADIDEDGGIHPNKGMKIILHYPFSY